MDRIILHVDMNCFYASVEMLHRPQLRNRPMAVGGDPEARHGIVLTANYPAKHCGVKTGMALWQARQICPDLVIVAPRMDLYLRFSRLANKIYGEYTDLRENFGIDEAWMDVTQTQGIKGSGESIAKEISNRIKKELGLTVSIGVSWNKIYAKLGSDYRKPDAITVFSRGNYRQMVWPLPVGNLLYVGKATEKKLAGMGIFTIGQLAEARERSLQSMLGKMGAVLKLFASGEDQTPVNREDQTALIKSVGNSMTTPRDLVGDQDVRIVMYLLAESIASRLKEHGLVGDVVEISVRDKKLTCFTRQKKLNMATNLSDEIESAAMMLFRQNYQWENRLPIRSLGIRVTNLMPDSVPQQLNLFINPVWQEKQRRMDLAVEDIRRRFGFFSVRRGIMHLDPVLSNVNAKGDHIVHPHSYFELGNRSGTDSFV